MSIPHRSQAVILAAIGILFLGFAHPASLYAKPPGGSGSVSFPHDQVSWSPDARFVANNVNHSPDDPKSPHSVFLTDMKTGQRWLLHSYPRKVDLLWSPGSNALAINDWGAGEESQCIVYVLTPQREELDLREEFLKSRRPDREKKLAADHVNYDHNYAHAIRWLSANKLLFVLEGHSTKTRRYFVMEYEYQIGDGFRVRERVIH